MSTGVLLDRYRGAYCTPGCVCLEFRTKIHQAGDTVAMLAHAGACSQPTVRSFMERLPRSGVT